MSPNETRLVQDTWSEVAPIADQAAAMFYERLFETAPALRSHFDPEKMPSQREKLVEALSAVVDALNCLDDIVPQLEDLGRRHRGYGVTDDHYETVGAALLWTLRKGLGNRWTREAEEAWSVAFTLVAGVMKSAANAVDTDGTATTSVRSNA